MKLPGDGTTPTAMQYLDVLGYNPKPVTSLGGASAKGDVAYSVGIELPPALLTPSVALSYSSAAEMSEETSMGWSLAGIPEIRRPMAKRAYTLKDKDEWFSAEFLINGMGVSGVLQPSGDKDNRYIIRSEAPAYLLAKYDNGADTWTVYHDALTWTLAAQDDGEDTDSGTAWWRAQSITDSTGNTISFGYNDNHTADTIRYGGNSQTCEPHLIEIAFTYADNTATRTNAQAGFVVEYAKHLTRVAIKTAGSAAESVVSDSFAVKEPAAASTPVSGTQDAGDSCLDGSAMARRYAYDLDYTVADSAVDLLSKISRDGEVIAEFSYSEYANSDTAERSSTSLTFATLGKTTSTTSDADHNGLDQTVSETTVRLDDVNRDGLPELMDATDADDDNKVWQVTPQKIDRDNRTFSLASAQTLPAIGGSPDASTTDEISYADLHEASYNEAHIHARL